MTLDQLSAAAKDISSKLGPFKFNLKRQDNYSGEHREWNEELTLPVGAALTEQIVLEALRTGQLVAVQADDATVDRVKAENEALLIALHDAIRRPMGVVPASADQFYSPAMADQAEAIRALKSRKGTGDE